MKASYNWLRALVPQITASPKELAARFTAGGLEVEALHAYGAGIESCVVASVVSMRPHPTKSGLNLVTVDHGAAEHLEIVCGAPNVPPPGGLVVLAPLGTHLPAKGMTIERRQIAGVWSVGMLCSEQELGLTEDSEGILVLPAGTAKPGELFAKAVPAAMDTVLEIGLTPNRPDGLGHIGLAREAAALYGFAWTSPEPEAPARVASGVKIDAIANVVVEDAERCPHYGANAVVDVTIGPSPLWLRYRLAALGVRSISNVVDITNLVMLEYGHPMHAFDLDRVRGGTVIVRRAKDGEKMVTLDGVDRTLTSDDLVICDAEGPVALGGVMGAANSEIQATTKRVLFECAYFEPRGVRRSSRRYGLHTEASHRFERGVDPSDVHDVLSHAASLATTLAAGAAVSGSIHVIGAPVTRRRVPIRASRIEHILGVHVPWTEAVTILKNLGCIVHASNDKDESAALDIPTHRPDIAREIDLIEEVLRVRGLDTIPTVLPAIRPTRDEGPRETLMKRARAAAIEVGLSEALTYSFTRPSALAAVRAPAASVVLQNPLGEHQSVMRTSLLPGLLDAVANARRHGERDVRLFTIGATFTASTTGGLPEERLQLAAVLSGDRAVHLSKSSAVDVWDAKGIAEGIARALTLLPASVRAFTEGQRPAHLHPRGAAILDVKSAPVGSLGLLHPDVIDAIGLEVSGDVVVVELDLETLAAFGKVTPQFKALPRFPASARDIAVVVSDNVRAGDVETAVRSAAGELAEEVRLFDRFTGGSIPAEHASLAFRVVYRRADRTLTDVEVDTQHAKVMSEVQAKFGATLRA